MDTNMDDFILSFYQGQIYFCNLEGEECNIRVYPKPNIYFDLIGISYFQLGLPKPRICCPHFQLYRGLVINQLGTGIIYHKHQLRYGTACISNTYEATLTKINNDWSPYDQTIRCFISTGYCPEGMVCVDDPSDDCDPNLVDYCPGLCVNE